MIKELNILGIFVPPLFAYATAAGLIWLVLRVAISRAGLHRYVWHPALFNTALYVLVLSLCVIFFFA